MRSILLVLCLAFAGYSIFVYRYSAGGHEAILTAEAKAGQEIWQEKNCQSCHQLYGLGGYMGPDLTNVITKRDKAYILAMVQNGTRKMPNFHLSADDAKSVIAFLSWVNVSGFASVPDSAVTAWGSYNFQ